MLRLVSTEERIVAVLHDVIEDVPEYKAEVSQLLSPRLLEALLAVTKQEDEHGAEGYSRFVERAARDPLARRVKIADLEDNLDITRLPLIAAKGVERLNRYLTALGLLRALEADFSV
jgi:(p)ppGpp synthase/HD superfamily hydrolase